MTLPLGTSGHVPVEMQIEQIGVQLSELELRLTKWMFICMILTVAIVAMLALPTLSGVPLAVFVAGSAIQMYAVWRM